MTIIPLVAQAKSRGSVRLKSKNPFDTPVVDPNDFDHRDDMIIMIKGKTQGIVLLLWTAHGCIPNINFFLIPVCDCIFISD